MTEEQLAAIEARAAAATPGPWHRIRALSDRWWTLGKIVDHAARPLPEDNEEADWSFAEHARIDVPSLVAALRQARAAALEEAACMLENEGWDTAREVHELVRALAREHRLGPARKDIAGPDEFAERLIVARSVALEEAARHVELNWELDRPAHGLSTPNGDRARRIAAELRGLRERIGGGGIIARAEALGAVLKALGPFGSLYSGDFEPVRKAVTEALRHG